MVERRIDRRFKALAERADEWSDRERERRAAALFYSHRDWRHRDECVDDLARR
ncbi:MAG: hypothetical protein ABEJ59_06725 [Halanaeroarchaeum sp.]